MMANIAIFFVSVTLQLITVLLLPATNAYTNLRPTLAVLVSINVAIWLYARMIASGVQLSVLIPIASAVIPIAVIAAGIYIYNEPAPVLKIVLLLSASILIGVASGVK
jgi:multidrug transporter EmrE-like cation transporter